MALKIDNLKVTAVRALTSAINIEYTTSVPSVVHNLYKYNWFYTEYSFGHC